MLCWLSDPGLQPSELVLSAAPPEGEGGSTSLKDREVRASLPVFPGSLCVGGAKEGGGPCRTTLLQNVTAEEAPLGIPKGRLGLVCSTVSPVPGTRVMWGTVRNCRSHPRHPSLQLRTYRISVTHCPPPTLPNKRVDPFHTYSNQTATMRSLEYATREGPSENF